MASADIFDGSFVNNFWGKDEKGSDIVFGRMDQGQITCENLIDIYQEKIQIEREYASRMQKLANKTLGAKETGTTKRALDKLLGEIANMGKAHLHESSQIENEILAPLIEFNKSFAEEKDKIKSLTESILKSKQSLFYQIEKNKNIYSTECIKLYNFYSKNKGNNSHAHQAELQQLERNLSRHRNKYETSVLNHKKALGKWVDQWQTAANDLQDLEFDRINYLKTNIWNFTNAISSCCVSHDHSCEDVRKALEQCDSANDIKMFVEEFRTGSEIYQAPEFVDYLNGETDEKLESVNSEKYTTANFESSFCSMTSSLNVAPRNDTKANHKSVKFTSSTNAGSSYYGDSLNSRVKQEPPNDDHFGFQRISDIDSDKHFKTQFDSLRFKKESPVATAAAAAATAKINQDEDGLQKIEIKSPFGTIQTVSRANTSRHNSPEASPTPKQKESPTKSFANKISTGANNNSNNLGVFDSKYHHNDAASSSGSSTGDSNSLARQNTYASSHTSSNYSNSSNKTWNSPTRHRSKMGLQNWMSDSNAKQSPTKKPAVNTSPILSSSANGNGGIFGQSSAAAAAAAAAAADQRPLQEQQQEHLMKLKQEKQMQVNRYYEMNKNDDSILNTSTMRNFNPEELGVEDPLRAALEDLKIGGNGDFNALKERHNSVKSTAKSSRHNKHSSSHGGNNNNNNNAMTDSSGGGSSSSIGGYKRKSMIDILKQANGKPINTQELHQQPAVQPPQQPFAPRANHANSLASTRPKSMIEIAEMNSARAQQQQQQQQHGASAFMNSVHTMANPSQLHLQQQQQQQQQQQALANAHAAANANGMPVMKKKIPVAQNGLPLVSSDNRPVVRHAKALYEYKASIPEEVSFKRKDLMLVLAMQDDGWWEVEVLNSGAGTPQFGLAPSNYLVPA